MHIYFACALCVYICALVFVRAYPQMMITVGTKVRAQLKQRCDRTCVGRIVSMDNPGATIKYKDGSVAENVPLQDIIGWFFFVFVFTHRRAPNNRCAPHTCCLFVQDLRCSMLSAALPPAPSPLLLVAVITLKLDSPTPQLSIELRSRLSDVQQRYRRTYVVLWSPCPGFHHVLLQYRMRDKNYSGK